jgi:hypothetical protein
VSLLPFSLLLDSDYFSGLDQREVWQALAEFDREALEAARSQSMLHRGQKLEPWEAERLEHILTQFEGDAWLRSLLLGYYLLRDPDRADRDAALKHVIWFIENDSTSHMAAHAGVLLLLSSNSRKCFSSSPLNVFLPPCNALAADFPGKYGDLINDSWDRALAASPDNAHVVGRAAQFFVYFDPVKSGQLFRDAGKRNPADPRWTEWLARLYHREFDSRRDESRPDWAAMAVAQWECALANCANDSHGRRVLCCAANCAFEARDYDKARILAHRLLEAPFDRSSVEQARHFGHELLGRIDLQAENVEQAKMHLFASIEAEAPDALRLAMIGPCLNLAKDLLQHGQTQAVLKYLKRCSELCAKEHAQHPYFKHLETRQRKYARFADQLEQGQTPDFDSEF